MPMLIVSLGALCPKPLDRSLSLPSLDDNSRQSGRDQDSGSASRLVVVVVSSGLLALRPYCSHYSATALPIQ